MTKLPAHFKDGLHNAAARSPLARSRRFARRVRLRPYEGELHRLGSDYGGWTIPVDPIRADWICYSGGAGEDISFDLALTDRFGCTIHAFDPTPSSALHVERTRPDPSRFSFHPWALWSHDGELELYAPAIGVSNFSALNLHHTDERIVVPARSLRSIVEELGHDRIDLLKLDIEGAEYAVLDSMLDDGIRPVVLCVEFHKTPWIRRMSRSARLLRASGYEAIALNGFDVTFVRSNR